MTQAGSRHNPRKFSLRILLAMVTFVAIVAGFSQIDWWPWLESAESLSRAGLSGQIVSICIAVLGLTALPFVPIGIFGVTSFAMCQRPAGIFIWSVPMGFATMMFGISPDSVGVFTAGYVGMLVGSLFAVAECYFEGLPRANFVVAMIAACCSLLTMFAIMQFTATLIRSSG
jgi:hypothetical protein